MVHRLCLGHFLRPALEAGNRSPRWEPSLGYLVDHPNGLVLVDNGGRHQPGYGPALPSHLHVDHIGANSVLARVPTYVQGAELAMLDQPEYTMTALIPELVEWVALDGTRRNRLVVAAVRSGRRSPGSRLPTASSWVR